jgi:ABC-type transporter lipoprotein component MlaA
MFRKLMMNKDPTKINDHLGCVLIHLGKFGVEMGAYIVIHILGAEIKLDQD